MINVGVITTLSPDIASFSLGCGAVHRDVKIEWRIDKVTSMSLRAVCREDCRLSPP